MEMEKTILLPAPGYVLLFLLSDDEVNDAGIYRPKPENRDATPAIAEVLAVGDPKPSETATPIPPPTFLGEALRPGDKIYYHRGTERKIPTKTKQAFLPWDHIQGIEK